ncbi:hypothetical protein B0T17DRAFT_530249 [Bombardia bombarda]|uniref:FAD-binding domain-containing protein n=1 Tax=Bombardia bombarda TaxID=252184 RepID=A0AA40CB64_9PEZI|nr:hypothetical protein B0T17DRAFT_530249 [Bombardia bombarda]
MFRIRTNSSHTQISTPFSHRSRTTGQKLSGSSFMAETVNPHRLQIAIVGAGIAGLSAAIALAHHPAVDVHVYERASELREIGASIALGPNGMRTLERLGVHEALDDDVAFRNKSGFPMIYRHWQTDETVSVDRHVGPVLPLHRTARFYRAHLQECLLRHVDPTKIHLGKAFRSVTSRKDTKRLVITFTDGTTSLPADIILGADGIHSAVRTYFVPESSTARTGWVAFRSVFPIEHVQHIEGLPDEASHIWGPDRTLFVSKLGRGLFTVVGSWQGRPDGSESGQVTATTTAATSEDDVYKNAVWDQEGDVEFLKSLYKDWGPVGKGIVDATPWTRVYPNAAAGKLDTWILGGDVAADASANGRDVWTVSNVGEGGFKGRVTLAGDAAHAHGGAFAAGGSLAIDDAWAFSAAIMHVFLPAPVSQPPTDENITKALRLYESTRKAHTDRVMDVVHAGNKKKAARAGGGEKVTETDEQLRERMKSRAEVAWIHEHDVVKEFDRAVKETRNGPRNTVEQS